MSRSEVRAGDVHGGAPRRPGRGRAQPRGALLPRVRAAVSEEQRTRDHAAGNYTHVILTHTHFVSS